MINWQEHGNPFLDFTEEITQAWNKLGFGKNSCKEWLDIGLKALDYDYAYWLELKGYNPEWVLNYNNQNGINLRKDYEKFVKKQAKKKKPKIKTETEKPKDPYSCKICDNTTFLNFKDYLKLHGKHKLNWKDPWIEKITKPFPKQFPGFIQKTYICQECKGEQHLKTCSYFRDYQKVNVENTERERE
ncbi:hypothetical protein [endosymbiont GvMRE of Glomus versiforme]|uniref:hypothetical protein n=1 Tax=endosymbiont GvMRE of Glomus versiforme TaxID=2039283 RepID=UPI000ED453E4|nr:hypothetical protein [endosymbiont GvMRE of Glomus versiforme]RHZ37764.1 hypothetical protein GvMRE_I1g36 [endosymbiont GvMRE of Glomus versiforme]